MTARLVSDSSHSTSTPFLSGLESPRCTVPSQPANDLINDARSARRGAGARPASYPWTRMSLTHQGARCQRVQNGPGPPLTRTRPGLKTSWVTFCRPHKHSFAIGRRSTDPESIHFIARSLHFIPLFTG